MSKVLDNYKVLISKAKQLCTAPDVTQIRVGSATCEISSGSGEVMDEFKKNIAASGASNVNLSIVGCTGRCSYEQLHG